MRRTTVELGGANAIPQAQRTLCQFCSLRVLIPVCISRARITAEQVKPRASLLPEVISIPSLPGPSQTGDA